MRGNVVELATAVIIGAAFTAIVTAFTEKIINPLIAVIPTGDCPQSPAAEGATPSNDFICGFGFAIDSDKPATFMDFGAVISAFINFVIVAAVVYFLIVVPYNKLQELRKLEDGEEDPDEEIVLLTQIRNALDPEAKERDAAAKAKADAEKAAQEARDRAAQTPAPVPAAPAAPAPGYGDRTQTMQVPPQAQQPGYQGQQQSQPGQSQQGQGFTPPAGPPTGGFPTPNPAPGEYPPPGNLPPGQYAPGQYPPPPGQDPGDAPRHSR
ncbi:large conductance mechanosensitive channel [Gordonia hydrophobica]|nr:large conductance mechanosensitive channel [Gordonia hydrophobica]